MLLDELRAKRSQILALATKYGAGNVRVFGSVARREDGPESDIDLLVSFPPGYDLLGQRMPFAIQLEDMMGRSVEIIPDHELNRHLRDAVLAEAIAL